MLFGGFRRLCFTFISQSSPGVEVARIVDMSHPYKSSPQKMAYHVVAVGIFFGRIFWKFTLKVLAENMFFSLTLPETNIAPENRPSQKETSIPTIHFQGRWLLVSGMVNYPIVFSRLEKTTSQRSGNLQSIPMAPSAGLHRGQLGTVATRECT